MPSCVIFHQNRPNTFQYIGCDRKYKKIQTDTQTDEHACLICMLIYSFLKFLCLKVISRMLDERHESKKVTVWLINLLYLRLLKDLSTMRNTHYPPCITCFKMLHMVDSLTFWLTVTMSCRGRLKNCLHSIHEWFN